MLIFGAGTGYETIRAVLTPEEAWHIDSKLDDGRPGTGRVLPRNPLIHGQPDCTTSSDPATSEYALTFTGEACGLHFITGL